MDKNIKIKLWFLFYVNKKQFLFIYIFLSLTTLSLAVISYYFPLDLDTRISLIGKLYAKNAVAFWIVINLYTIIEGLFFWNYFYKEQIKIINSQKEEIESQKEEIIIQRDNEIEFRKKIESQNQQIISSIQYAQRIQQAVLPKIEEIDTFKNFILFMPRDIVSGDFYWFKSLKNKNEELEIIVAADCTGHGIPGAFVSMLGISLLNEITSIKNIIKPNEILNELRSEIKKSLHQHGNPLEQQDGMDIAIVVLNKNKKTFDYSGANNSLYISTLDTANYPITNDKIKITDKNINRKLITIKPDKMPVGIYYAERDFTNHSFKYSTGDILYLFSDGFIDQFGGKNGEKFMTKRFKNLILEISIKNMIEQKNILTSTLNDWKKDRKQLDDILVMGIEL